MALFCLRDNKAGLGKMRPSWRNLKQVLARATEAGAWKSLETGRGREGVRNSVRRLISLRTFGFWGGVRATETLWLLCAVCV
jgi:hypothetical protein